MPLSSEMGYQSLPRSPQVTKATARNRPREIDRAAALGRYPNCNAIRRMRSLRLAMAGRFSLFLPLRTREAVPGETPARMATSSRVVGWGRFIDLATYVSTGVG